MTAYEIGVQGQIDARWAVWFDGMDITHSVDEDGESITTFRGSVSDQAALRGLLSRIWDLNLTLVSLHRLQGGRAH